MAKKTAPKAEAPQPTKSQKAPAKPIEETPAGVAYRGELAQLAAIRSEYPPLTEAQSTALFEAHDAVACMKRADSTRASDVFRTAMSWARNIAGMAGKEGISATRGRWFLDCLTAVGHVLAGKQTSVNPSGEASYDDVVKSTSKLLKRTKRKLGNAIGSHAQRLEALKEATRSQGDTGHAVAFRLTAKLITDLQPQIGDALEVDGIGAHTVKQLEDAATALEAATARRPAARKGDKDGPALNEVEGRLLFAMRVLWNDVKDAREDSKSEIQLSTSPAILRGLRLRKTRSKAGGEEPGEDEDLDEEDLEDEEGEDEETEEEPEDGDEEDAPAKKRGGPPK